MFPSQYTEDNLAMIVGLITGLAFVSVLAYQRWFYKYRAPSMGQTPVLMVYFTQGNDLMSAHKKELSGVKGGASCNYMITLPRKASESKEISVEFGTTLILVELPFRSKLHLLAIAKDSNLAQLNPTYGDSVMEKVELEGDFYNYFSLYADKGQQVQARYVIDPAAMSFVADFCKKYHWEIIDDTLFFAAKTSLPDNETITEFIEQIRPAVESKDSKSRLTKARAYKYKESVWPRKSAYKCPICYQALVDHRYWHECTNGHGQLIKGGDLVSIKENVETYTPSIAIEDDEPHQRLNCPACGKQMTPINYAGSKIIIDSCLKCTYRWLDAGEIEHILKGTGRA